MNARKNRETKMNQLNAKGKADFLTGLRLGIPIALGYISVSFGIGITAVTRGLSALEAVLLSLTNLTSAGQVAGIDIMVAGGAIIEMILAQLTINARYSMMSLSLSQKVGKEYGIFHRFTTSFGITDEVFGVAASRREPITPKFMYGLILLPATGWTLGTLLGAVAGNILPESIKLALGIAIYGMFVAIVVPPAKGDVGILTAALTAIALSCSIAYIPIFSLITPGFSIIICALVASAVAALLFPIKDETESEEKAESTHDNAANPEKSNDKTEVNE